MSITTISSFVIGAILLIAVLTVNNNLMNTSEGVTLDQINKDHLTDVTNIVSNDFRKMGYGVTGTGISVYQTNELSYQCDLNNDGVLHQVTWEYETSVPVSTTSNPNDKMLLRIVDSDTTKIAFGITKFNITLLDSLGNQTSSLTSAKQVEVFIDCQSPVMSHNSYLTASWQRIFTPMNL